MLPEFWMARWAAGKIGFHMDDVNPDLLAHEAWFLETEPRRVLVPLCGKSRDLLWLAEQGHEVVGVELVSDAVEQFFIEADLIPEWQEVQGGRKATVGRLTIFQGDFFEIPHDELGDFDRIWDRAALVALHPDQRDAYIRKCRMMLTDSGVVLLNVLQYDPEVMTGPPWSIEDEEVMQRYNEVQILGSSDILDDRRADQGHRWMRSVLFRAHL